MESLQNVINLFDKLKDDLLNGPDYTTINEIEHDKEQIKSVNDVENQLNILLSDIEQLKSLLNTAFNKKTDIFKNKLMSLINSNENKQSWSNIATNAHTRHQIDIIQPSLNSNIEREIAPGVNIQVKSVKTPDLIPNTEIYYIESCNQFAFKLNNILFRGNVGKIIGKNEVLVKVIDCVWGPRCNDMENCTYYHDPLYCPGSKDVRNFSYFSWLYNQENRLNPKAKNSRSVGHRDYLKTDLRRMDAIEARSLVAQSMHDILLSMCISTKLLPRA